MRNLFIFTTSSQWGQTGHRSSH